MDFSSFVGKNDGDSSDSGGSGSSASSFGGFGQTGDPWGQTLGFGASWLGSEKANRQNRANQQWAFSSAMEASSTAMQRRAADLEKAGLNPVLAVAQQQGAGGVEASGGHEPKNIAGGAMASAYQARMVDAEVRQKDSQTAINNVEVARVVQDTFLKGATAENVRAMTGRIEVEMQKLRQEVEYLKQQELTSLSQARLNAAETQLKNLEALHSALSLNKSVAESDKAGNWWGKNVSPYLGDLGSIINSAAGALGGGAAAKYIAGGRAKSGTTNVYNMGGKR